MTDQVMMELAKMQTKIRAYEHNEKKHIEQLHLRDEEISQLKKKIDLYKTVFIPVDSEHFSIWSLTNNIQSKNIEKIYITASGGPFNKLKVSQFKSINKNSALKHPNWKMGKK